MYQITLALIKKHKDSIVTTLSLLINRGLDAVVLLVITPYLIKTFSIEFYGEMIYYLSIIYIIQTVIIFGFDNYILYKTSNIKRGQSEILSTIISVKLILLFITSIGYIIYCLFTFETDGKYFYPYLFLILPLAECFNFSHYFVVEKMTPYLVKISIFRLAFFATLTLTLINSPSDLNLYSLVLTLSYLFSVLIQNIMLKKHRNITIRLVYDWKNIRVCFKDASKFFGLKFFQVLSDKLYIIIAGMWIGYSSVTIIDISIKLYLVILMPVQILVVGILPKFIKKESTLDFRYCSFLVILISIILIPSSILFKNNIDLYFFHRQLEELNNLYLIISISAILFIISFLISELYLNPMGMLSSSIYSSAFTFIITSVIVLFFHYFFTLTTNKVLLIFLISKFLDCLFKWFLLLNNNSRKNKKLI
ncbi:hypothetical protein AB7W40_14810 [Providencia rettgeri]|uniref:hypothetical protein n=1 Tax=Providencia rettgeri TaxID=587 RepID=UPI001ADB6322|nr:hypothetical protein [Providencia rettgeri]MBO8256014.1 hypothetical protein [Providencia rettgeri]MBO8259845.1 hypothetical protein [Providencia rettgeri]